MEAENAAAAAAATAAAEPSQLEQALGQLPEEARRQIEQRMIEIETAKQEQQKIANEATAKLENGSEGDKVYLKQQLAMLLDHLGAVGPQFNVAGVDEMLGGPMAPSAVSRLVAACNTKFMGLDAPASARPAKRSRTAAPPPAQEQPVVTEAPAAHAAGRDLLKQALAARYS